MRRPAPRTSQNVRLVIETEVALDYFQLHGLDAQRQLLNTTITA